MNSFRNFKNTCILSLKKGDKTVGVMGTIILLISWCHLQEEWSLNFDHEGSNCGCFWFVFSVSIS